MNSQSLMSQSTRTPTGSSFNSLTSTPRGQSGRMLLSSQGEPQTQTLIDLDVGRIGDFKIGSNEFKYFDSEKCFFLG